MKKQIVYPDTTTYRAWHRLLASGEPVCAAWRKDFVNFVSDMGAEPSADCVLTRKDPAIEHRLANARWAAAPAKAPAPAPAAAPVAGAKSVVGRAIDALRRRIGR